MFSFFSPHHDGKGHKLKSSPSAKDMESSSAFPLETTHEIHSLTARSPRRSDMAARARSDPALPSGTSSRLESIHIYKSRFRHRGSSGGSLVSPANPSDHDFTFQVPARRDHMLCIPVISMTRNISVAYITIGILIILGFSLEIYMARKLSVATGVADASWLWLPYTISPSLSSALLEPIVATPSMAPRRIKEREQRENRTNKPLSRQQFSFFAKVWRRPLPLPTESASVFRHFRNSSRVDMEQRWLYLNPRSGHGPRHDRDLSVPRVVGQFSHHNTSRRRKRHDALVAANRLVLPMSSHAPEHLDASSQHHHNHDDPIHDTVVRPFEKAFYEECVPMKKWQTIFYPTCNALHETPLTVMGQSVSSLYQTTDVSLLSLAGSWRSVWRISISKHVKPVHFSKSNHTATTKEFSNGASSTGSTAETVVLKMLHLSDHHRFDPESFHLHQIDAMAMERLTSSPYVVNLYSFCGQSVVTESAVPHISAREYIKDANHSTLDRLRLARDLARGLADIHSIDYANSTNATLAHNDLNMANLIVVPSPSSLPEYDSRHNLVEYQIKYNDFNIAVPMRWNVSGNTGCGYPPRFHAPLWKSPEEVLNASYVDPALSDVYSFGNLIFQVVTRHQPWTHLEEGGRLNMSSIVEFKTGRLREEKTGRFRLPHLPSRYRLSPKTAQQAMIEVVRSCYRLNPDDRLTSFELAQGISKVYEYMLENPAHQHYRHAPSRELVRRVLISNHSSLDVDSWEITE
jgi:Protein kinase domain